MHIEFQGVTLSFNGREIIRSFSLEIRDGERISIGGPSGCGKSSLLHVLTGFVKPSAGVVKVDGNVLHASAIGQLRKKMAYMPQEVQFNDLEVRQFIMMPFQFRHNRSIAPDEKTIHRHLDQLGLNPSILDKPMQEISGGEKQRISLTACLLLQRKLLLLDEPTSSLDREMKNRVMDHIFSLPDVTMLSASHDDEWVSRCDKYVNIKNL
ncbi:MAG: ATP-binding cassette domain-containing protein [Bacteroidales bacterium]